MTGQGEVASSQRPAPTVCSQTVFASRVTDGRGCLVSRLSVHGGGGNVMGVLVYQRASG
jgi:hypothetical protein